MRKKRQGQSQNKSLEEEKADEIEDEDFKPVEDGEINDAIEEEDGVKV